MILEQESIDVFLGLDVRRTGHQAVVLNRAGKKLYENGPVAVGHDSVAPCLKDLADIVR